jgi:hypothetical protein
MDNCIFETLLVNHSGIATLCKGCGNIHVGYGNFMLVFSAESFPLFTADLENMYRSRDVVGQCRKLKNIIVKTPAKEVSLLFSLSELGAFIRFLHQVGDMLLVKKLAREARERDHLSVLN